MLDEINSEVQSSQIRSHLIVDNNYVLMLTQSTML